MSFRHLIPTGLVLIVAGCVQNVPQPPSGPPVAETVKAQVLPVPTAAVDIKAEPVVAQTTEPQQDQPQSKNAQAGNPAVTKDAHPPANDLTARALKTAEGGDMDQAVKLLDQAIAAEPDNHDALWLLARIVRHQASEEERPKSSPLWLKYAATMRKLRASSHGLSAQEKTLFEEALYREACTEALAGKKDEAMKALNEAVASGYDQADTLQTDKELDSLRALPEFQELEKKLVSKGAAQAQEDAKELLAQNKPFPFSFDLPGLDGKNVALAGFKGKVTIVDVWATWCPPCRAEIPHFVALYKKYHEKGLEIVGLNYEREDDEKAAKKVIQDFVAEHKVPYPCLIGDDKTQDQIPKFEGFPTTLFLDRAGVVRAKMVGFDPSHVAELAAIVETLLAEEAPKPIEKP